MRLRFSTCLNACRRATMAALAGSVMAAMAVPSAVAQITTNSGDAVVAPAPAATPTRLREGVHADISTRSGRVN